MSPPDLRGRQVTPARRAPRTVDSAARCGLYCASRPVWLGIIVALLAIGAARLGRRAGAAQPRDGGAR
jgi:hypothetical protein